MKPITAKDWFVLLTFLICGFAFMAVSALLDMNLIIHAGYMIGGTAMFFISHIK